MKNKQLTIDSGTYILGAVTKRDFERKVTTESGISCVVLLFFFLCNGKCFFYHIRITLRREGKISFWGSIKENVEK